MLCWQQHILVMRAACASPHCLCLLQYQHFMCATTTTWLPLLTQAFAPCCLLPPLPLLLLCCLGPSEPGTRLQLLGASRQRAASSTAGERWWTDSGGDSPAAASWQALDAGCAQLRTHL